MRDALIAAMKIRRCQGLFMWAVGAFVFSFAFSLGLASGKQAAAKRPVVSQNGDRTGVDQAVAAWRWQVAGVVLDSQSNPV